MKSERRGETNSVLITHRINFINAANGQEQREAEISWITFSKCLVNTVETPKNVKLNFKVIASLRKYYKTIFFRRLSDNGISNRGFIVSTIKGRTTFAIIKHYFVIENFKDEKNCF